MKFQMPEELGGQIYECLDFIPHRVNMQLAKAQKADDEELVLEIILLNLIVSPKFTKEYLNSNDCNGMVTSLLTLKIMDDLNITQERVEELKKKLVKL